MEMSWEIEEAHRQYRIHEDGSLEPCWQWLLRCPNGHLLLATTNFASLQESIQVGCPTCKKSFAVILTTESA